MRSDLFIAKVLDAPNGGVEELLQLSGGDENDWLEFKASIYAIGNGDLDVQDRGDLAWNIARAVVALANTKGGALLVGVDDNGEPVGLEASDPGEICKHEGPESFLRKVIEPLIRPAQGWNTKKHGRLRLSKELPVSHIEFKVRPYKSVDVVIIVVRPLEQNDDLIGAVSSEQRKQFFPVRVLGDIGRVRDLYIFDDIVRFRRDELSAAEQFEALWNQFAESHEGNTQSRNLPNDSEVQIGMFYELFASKFQSISNIFTPLSSVEHIQPVDPRFPEPLASEEPVEYESWDVDSLLDPQHEARGDSFASGAIESIDQPVVTYHARTGPVLELMHQIPRSLWLGAPGSGKSTCLIRHCLQVASTYKREGVVAVYAPLRAYGRSGDLWGLLTEITGLDFHHLEKLASLGRLWLHLDGLNECPAQMQLGCKNEIRGFLARYPQCGLLVTTRLGRVGAELGLPAFTILPLDREQQQRFLAAYFSEESSALTTLQTLWRQPGGDSIACNPFILRLLADIAPRDDEDFAWSRAQIYRHYLAAWHRREVAKSNRTHQSVVASLQGTRTALGLLAFRSRRGGMVSVSYEFALSCLREFLSNQSEDFLHWAGQGLILNIDSNSRMVTFGHETIQEYFCAEYILENQTTLSDLSELDSPTWTVAIALALELGGQIDEPFVSQAIRITPILCALFISDELSKFYRSHKFGRDPWTAGVVACLLGADSIDSSDISDRLESEIPPRALQSILRSDIFWYSAGVSPWGMQRVQRLFALMRDASEPWADLLPACREGNSQLSEQLVQDAPPALLFACGIGEYHPDSHMEDLKANASLLARSTIRAYDKSTYQLSKLKPFLRDTIQSHPDLLTHRQWDQLIRRGFLGFPFKDRWTSEQVGNFILRQPILWPRIKQYRPDLLTIDHKQGARALIAADMPMWRLALSVRLGLVSAPDVTMDMRRSLLTRLEQISPERIRVSDLRDLVVLGLIAREDISLAYIQQCISKQGDSAILPALLAGFLSENDIDEATLTRAFKALGPSAFLTLRKTGTLSSPPKECKQYWLRTLSGAQIEQLVARKVVDVRDVSEDLREFWLREKSIDENLKLFRAGLISSEHIQRRIRVEDASAPTLAELITIGAVDPMQLPDELVHRALNSGHTGLIVLLVEKGRVQAEEVRSKNVGRFSNEMAFRLAARLVKLQIVLPDDFAPEVRKYWAENLSIRNLAQAIRLGMLRIEEVSESDKLKVANVLAAAKEVDWGSTMELEHSQDRQSPLASGAQPLSLRQLGIRDISELVKSGSLSVSIFGKPSIHAKIQDDPFTLLETVDALVANERWMDAGYALLMTLYNHSECLSHKPMALKVHALVTQVMAKANPRMDFSLADIGEEVAKQIDSKLAGRVFLSHVAYVAPDGRGTGWLHCDSLPDRIYCNFNYIPNIPGASPLIGFPIYGSVKIAPSREQGTYLLKTGAGIFLPDDSSAPQ